jgi:lipopolysaccharide transport system ATP-binding protein
MSDIAIRVQNLSKLYKIGARQQGYKTLRESVMSVLTSPLQALKKTPHSALRTPQSETIWALKNVSFEVKPGEVVGIIGRNGAGKTTLLKILSRITEPTKGRCEIHGRVSSLLEVGTGFHPELTGRENIYLNGAILGMSREEINRKFDEIVDFAEIEKFIDTPVKRYSSGMYVRLAFAVAAHLEPEILLVDEVLAVGDVAFRKKCIGKMGDVAKEGRTILFVSHNIAAVESLCSRGLILSQGRLVLDGPVHEATNKYSRESLAVSTIRIRDRKDRQGNGEAIITDIKLIAPDGIASGKQLSVVLHYESTELGIRIVNAGLSIWTLQDVHLISLEAKHQPAFIPMDGHRGKIVCTIPELPLVPGEYFLNPSIFSTAGLADYVTHAVPLSVGGSDFYGSGKLPDRQWGLVLLNHSWTVDSSKTD